MGKTSIEWCEHSINPIRARMNGRVGHHCVKISPGCANCYASRLQARFGMPPYQANRREDVELFLDSKALEEVRRRKKPTRYFWCDMTDMFLEGIPREWLKAIMGVWVDTPQHTHMVLTKRPHGMKEYFRQDRPPSNVWAGVSVENEAMKWRIDTLRGTPFYTVRFLSLEPLLEDIGQLDLRGIAWVIVGGESGSGARPCDVAWIRSIRDQCQAAGVPVFVKQIGSNPIPFTGSRIKFYKPDQVAVVLNDRKGGDWNEWPADLRIREFPAV